MVPTSHIIVDILTPSISEGERELLLLHTKEKLEKI